MPSPKSSLSLMAFPPDDILREILLRLPPRQSSLLRAASVSKHQCAITVDPRFLRRYQAHHGGDGILGVLHNNPRAEGQFVAAADPPDRVSVERFSPPNLCCDRWLILRRGRWLVLGCHRGRAVLHDGAGRLLVWDPITDSRCHVDLPPLCNGTHHGLNAVIIVDDDDGEEEENGSFHFRIAVASVAQGTAISAVYSSEKGAWGQQATADAWTSLPSENPGVAVGDAVYWLLNDGRILSLKLRDGGLSILPAKVPSLYADNVQLTITPAGGEIGLAAVSGSALHMLALETDDEYGTTSWVVRRTVVLDEEIVPSGGPVEGNGEPKYHARIVGTHDDGAVVFLWTVHGVYMVRLQLQPEATQTMTKKLHGIDETNGHFYAVYPFAGFFTPKVLDQYTS